MSGTSTAALTDEQKTALIDKLLQQQAGSNGNGAAQTPQGGLAGQFQQQQQPQQQGGLPEARALLVPLEMVDQGGGRVEVYLQFDPSHAGNIDGLLRTLSNAGVPLKVWKPKNRNGYGGNSGGGGYGNSGGGGYGNSGGGYGR